MASAAAESAGMEVGILAGGLVTFVAAAATGKSSHLQRYPQAARKARESAARTDLQTRENDLARATCEPVERARGLEKSSADTHPLATVLVAAVQDKSQTLVALVAPREALEACGMKRKMLSAVLAVVMSALDAAVQVLAWCVSCAEQDWQAPPLQCFHQIRTGFDSLPLASSCELPRAAPSPPLLSSCE
jgi:hypothetical protein